MTAAERRTEALQKLRAAQQRVTEAQQDELVALAEFMAADRAARAEVGEAYFREEVRP